MTGPLSTSDQESGQLSILVLGMTLIALTLVLGVIGATSVQLSRIHLLDAADAAALDASDEIDQETVYRQGLGQGVPLSDSQVQQAAAAHLAARELPARVRGWTVAPGTGTPDGRTAVVRVQGVAGIPVISQILSAFGGGVTVTVESRARSDLD